MNAIFKWNYYFKFQKYNYRYPSYALIYTLKTRPQVATSAAFGGLQTKVEKNILRCEQKNSSLIASLHLNSKLFCGKMDDLSVTAS